MHGTKKNSKFNIVSMITREFGVTSAVGCNTYIAWIRSRAKRNISSLSQYLLGYNTDALCSHYGAFTSYGTNLLLDQPNPYTYSYIT